MLIFLICLGQRLKQERPRQGLAPIKETVVRFQEASTMINISMMHLRENCNLQGLPQQFVYTSIYFDRPLKKKLFVLHVSSVLTQRESHYADWVVLSACERDERCNS